MFPHVMPPWPVCLSQGLRLKQTVATPSHFDDVNFDYSNCCLVSPLCGYCFLLCN